MQMDSVIAPVLQVKFCFMGCLVKASNSIRKQIVVIITVNSIIFAQHPPAKIFLPVFSWILENCCSISKKKFQKFLESSLKKTPVANFTSVKLWVFTEVALEVFCKRGVLRNFANLQENTCNRDSVLIKLQG